MPLSRDPDDRRSASAHGPRAIRPPGSVYLAALVRRLTSDLLEPGRVGLQPERLRGERHRRARCSRASMSGRAASTAWRARPPRRPRTGPCGAGSCRGRCARRRAGRRRAGSMWPALPADDLPRLGQGRSPRGPPSPTRLGPRPAIAASGLRSSWASIARNSSLRRSASRRSRCSRAASTKSAAWRAYSSTRRTWRSRRAVGIAEEGGDRPQQRAVAAHQRRAVVAAEAPDPPRLAGLGVARIGLHVLDEDRPCPGDRHPAGRDARRHAAEPRPGSPRAGRRSRRSRGRPARGRGAGPGPSRPPTTP